MVEFFHFTRIDDYIKDKIKVTFICCRFLPYNMFQSALTSNTLPFNQSTTIKSSSNFQNIVEYKLKLLPQIIVFFSIFNVSLRPLQYFSRNIMGIPLSQDKIKKALMEASENAKDILEITDKLAGKKARVVEIDTTWKGLKRKFLGVIEQTSHYLFEFRSVRNESNKVLRPILQHLKEMCPNLKIILTDLALGFEAIIPKIFNKALHMFCNVHAVRVLWRLLSGDRKKVTRIRKEYKKNNKSLKKIKFKRGNHRKKLYNKRSYRKKLVTKKIFKCKLKNILVKPNGATFVGRQGLPSDIKKVSIRLSKITHRIKSLTSTVKRQSKKFKDARSSQIKSQKNYFENNASYLYYCRLIARFKRLMRIKEPKLFKIEEKRFLNLLKARSDTICNKIAKFIEDHPQIFPGKQTKSTHLLKNIAISTNTIEGFFSKTRIMLDTLRNVPDTPFIRCRFILFRYWHNVGGPLSGCNANQSPCQRLDICQYSSKPIQTICKGIEI